MLATSTTSVLCYANIQPCPDAFEVAFSFGHRKTSLHCNTIPTHRSIDD
jgi:hypothetical protein